MQYKGFTDEQNAKAATCKTPAELLALVKDEGVEVPDEALEQIAGGSAWGTGNSGSCPQCGGDHFWISEDGSEAWCECGYRGKASSFFNH